MIDTRYRYSLLIVLPVWMVLLGILIGNTQTSEVSAQAEDITPTPAYLVEEYTKDKNVREDRSKPAGVSVSPLTSGGPDHFGYHWNDNQAFAWIDSTSGELLDLTGDDNVSDPIPIGFNFPFYENTYNQLYITTNGLITFNKPDTSLDLGSLYDNREMPFIVEPQNFIAPFWDDLHVPKEGGVYYHANAERLVVTWHKVARIRSTDLLTFQAILYKNGDICLQYQTLNGILNESTVGIEDTSGSDGLTYLHNSDGLNLIKGLKKVCFTRPAQSYRAKLLPIYQGGIVIGGSKVFNLEVINTGDIGPDSYELFVSLSDPSWRLEISTADGKPLSDNDHDGRYETGIIQTGQSLSLLAKLYSPKDFEISENTFVDIVAYSQNQPTAQNSVKIHGAVPSPFVQGIVIENEKSMLMTWAKNSFLSLVSPNYTGSTIGVMHLPGDRYQYLWEQNYTFKDSNGKNINYTDIEFSLIDGFGQKILGPSKLTSNQNSSSFTNKITDRSPVSTVTNDGRIGVVWVRYIDNGQTGLKQSNVFFAIYDQKNLSTPLAGPINVTNNNNWSGYGITNVPIFYSPQISFTNNNRFVITWSDSRKHSDGDTEQIGFAAYEVTGHPFVYRESVPGLVSTPGTILFRSPDILGVTGNQILLSYVQENVLTDTPSIGYLVLDSSGNKIKNPSLIAGVEGLTPITLQFSSGPILLAWLNPSGSKGVQQATFITLDQSTFEIATGPTELITPNVLSADLMSVSQDIYGNAIFSWMDMDVEQSIFYALVGYDGSVITPPIQSFESEDKTITISKVGSGNAAYIPKNFVFLPVTNR